MCDKNSSLNKAILAQVQEFATTNTTFSVHDVTRGLRTKANNNQISIPELATPNSQYSHNIPHSVVKSAFAELRQDDVFSELNLTLTGKYNGMYFEYTPALVTAGSSAPALAQIPSAPLQTFAPAPIPTVQPAVNVGKNDEATVLSRIDRFLSNTGKQAPTIKQVQAAIKCNGWTCSDLNTLLNAKGYTVTMQNVNVSESTVSNP